MRFRLQRGIHVDAQESISAQIVRDVTAFLQLKKLICTSGHAYLDATLDQLLFDPLGDVQRDGLFLKSVSGGAAVLTAVTSVDNDEATFEILFPGLGSHALGFDLVIKNNGHFTKADHRADEGTDTKKRSNDAEGAHAGISVILAYDRNFKKYIELNY